MRQGVLPSGVIKFAGKSKGFVIAYITIRIVGILQSITGQRGFQELGKGCWKEMLPIILSQVPKDSEVYSMLLVKEVREIVNVNYYLETWITYIQPPWILKLMTSFGVSYYLNLLYFRARGGHLHGTVGEIIVQLPHVQNIFYPSTWYSMSLLELSLNIQILVFLIYELFINLKSSSKHLLGTSFCTGTRNRSFSKNQEILLLLGVYNLKIFLDQPIEKDLKIKNKIK